MEAWVYNDGHGKETRRPYIFLPGVGHLSFDDATRYGGKDPYQDVRLAQGSARAGIHPVNGGQIRRDPRYERVRVAYPGKFEKVVKELEKVNALREKRNCFDETRILEIDAEVYGIMHGLDSPLRELRQLIKTLDSA